jgi:hypothetical protein
MVPHQSEAERPAPRRQDPAVRVVVLVVQMAPQ